MPVFRIAKPPSRIITPKGHQPGPYPRAIEDHLRDADGKDAPEDRLAEDLRRHAAPFGGVGNDVAALALVGEEEEFGFRLPALILQAAHGDGRHVGAEFEVLGVAHRDARAELGGAALELFPRRLHPAVREDFPAEILREIDHKNFRLQHDGAFSLET